MRRRAFLGLPAVALAAKVTREPAVSAVFVQDSPKFQRGDAVQFSRGVDWGAGARHVYVVASADGYGRVVVREYLAPDDWLLYAGDRDPRAEVIR